MLLAAGGLPNGKYVPTSEGVEQHYGVQVLSRFLLAYKLAVESDPIVKKGVLSVMAPGKQRPAVDYEDIDLAKANKKGSYGLLRASSRDSVVVDTFTEVSIAFPSSFTTQPYIYISLSLPVSGIFTP